MTQPPNQHAPRRKTDNELVETAERLGLEAKDLDEAVHDAKGEEAAHINNAGLEAQIEYLVATHGATTVEELLRHIEAETDDQEG